NGTDAVPTLDEFVALVQQGQVRYVIEPAGQWNGSRGGGLSSGDESSASAQIRTWVGQHCAVDASAPSTVYACG
ncbi:4-amino-4-deoxy-L-arabinose transferase, partial [Microbacterium sp. HMWF026]